MDEILPIFTTNLSLGSIITVEPSNRLKTKENQNKPEAAPSLFDCLDELGTKELYIADSFFVAFLRLFNQCKKEGVNLHYGIKFQVCADASSQESSSQLTESKYIVWAKNGLGIKRLQKLYSHCSTKCMFANKDYKNNKEYKRADWKILRDFWDDSELLLMSCFYDGFISKNLLSHGYNHIPQFEGLTKPIFEIQNNLLPQDEILREKTGEYCKLNGYDVIEAKTIKYRKRSESKAYQIYNAVLNRRTFQVPEDKMSSSEFCVESILNPN